ncbi:GNAT family N-acetyltransferase [Streptomyces sp. NPDC051582]|uniref:GNAT family N-acetyltransferase n=1 Tax=Streptomyces sp. NPDC051582 TaxID=3155167 RepID=UPI0034466A5B
MDVIYAEDEDAVRRCWPVFSQLRPHLDEEVFAERWRTQSAEGYRIVFLEEEGEVRVVAGFRVMHTMISGRILYLDDLVADESARGRGLGSRMLTELKAIAADEGCAEFHLDTGHQRHAAHRTYLRNGFRIDAHHVSMTLR